MKHPNERRPLDRLRNPRALQGLTLVAAMAAASCGGGGGGGAAAGSGPLSGTEGRLAPLMVGGLSYETATLSGITDAGGRFRYEPGESVRFFLGDTTLGTDRKSVV